MRIALAALVMIAGGLCGPQQAAAEKIYLSCHAIYPTINREADYSIVIDTVAGEIQVDGEQITRGGVPRSIQQDDGTVVTFVDQLFRLDSEMIEWGQVSKGRRLHPPSSVNRITGQYRNEYGSGPCKRVTGPVF